MLGWSACKRTPQKRASCFDTVYTNLNCDCSGLGKLSSFKIHPRYVFLRYTLPLLGVCGLLFAHFYLVSSRSLDIPARDELEDIVFFLSAIVESVSFADYGSALLEQHASHRTLSSRLVFWIMYSIQDGVVFETLIVVAQMGVVLLLGLIYLTIQDHKDKNIIILLVSLCLLNPRAYTLMSWSQAAMAFYFVSFYAFAALVFLRSERWIYLLAGALAAVLATYTLAAGILIWPVGLLYLIYLYFKEKSRSKYQIAVWCFSASACMGIYLVGFTGGSGSAESFTLIIENPIYALEFFLVLAGSAFSYESVVLAKALGFSILLTSCFLFLRGFRVGFSVWHFFLAYLLLYMSFVTFGRIHFSLMSIFGEPILLGWALKPRYSYNSMLTVAVIIIMLFPRDRIISTAKITLVIFFISTLSAGNYLVFTKKLDQVRANRISGFNKFGVYPWFVTPPHIREKIDHAESLGIYVAPPLPYKRLGPAP
jgi:hypothetical protein